MILVINQLFLVKNEYGKNEVEIMYKLEAETYMQQLIEMRERFNATGNNFMVYLLDMPIAELSDQYKFLNRKADIITQKA